MNERYSYYRGMSDEEKEAKLEDRNSQMNEEEIEAINQAIELLDFEKYALADIPEGTICTTPYYEDFLVMVMKQ